MTDTIKIKADPIGDTAWQMTCTECGNLGQHPPLHRDIIALTHLAAHGVDVPYLYVPSPN